MKKNIISEKNICAYKKGFTLIEALVAIFILTISATALLGVVSQNVFNSNYTKNKVTAIALAQEGVELVRNIQDSNLLSQSGQEGQSFVVFLGTYFQYCVFNQGVCTIDPTTLIVTACPFQGQNPECPRLRLSNIGYYDYSLSGSLTPFTRSIEVQPTSPNSGKVIVTVSWEQGSVTKSVVYETEIFPWI